MLIVGAGPGLELAIARRFGRTGGAVGLISRSAARLTELTHTLDSEGIQAAWASADATNPMQLRAAIQTIGDRIGPIETLCFSPLPAIELIKPVLETQAEELTESLALNVGGAAAAVAEVLPAMLDSGRGSLLFTTGSGALHPSASRAASAVTTAAETVYVSLLHEALAPSGIVVAQLVVVGAIGPGQVHEPAQVADALWALNRPHTESLSVLR